MKPLLLWFTLAQGSDVATTAAALHRGCVERFMMPEHPRAGLAVKAGAAFVVGFTLRKNDTKAGKAALLVGAISGTVGAVLNARTLPACRP